MDAHLLGTHRIIESVRVGGTVRIPVGELDRLPRTHPTNEENRR